MEETREHLAQVEDLSAVGRALSHGQLDLFRAQIIAEELTEADHDTCTAVE